MVSKRNQLMFHFSRTIHLLLASFYAQNTEKKLARRKKSANLERNVEFELGGPGPPGRTCTPITG